MQQTSSVSNSSSPLHYNNNYYYRMMSSRERRKVFRSGSMIPFVTTKDHNPLAKFSTAGQRSLHRSVGDSNNNSNNTSKDGDKDISVIADPPPSLTPLVYNRAVLRGLANNDSVLLNAVTRLRRTDDTTPTPKIGDNNNSNEVVPFFSESPSPSPSSAIKLPSSPLVQRSAVASAVLAHHKNSENEKKAAKAVADKLSAHFHEMQMSSMIQTSEINNVAGLTTIPEKNLLAVVHDESRISIFAVVKDWQLQMIATYSVNELDRRQKPQPLAMNGVIAAVPNQIFVLNKTATRLMRFNFELFEAARSADAFEDHEVTAELMGKSLVGTMLGLTVILKHNELYTSTGDHIVVYSIESGCELLRSAVVQPPSSIVANWGDSGVCYGIPTSETAAMRIKFFRDNKKHDGYDVKIVNTKGIFGDGGATYDSRSNSLLVVSNDSVVAVASVDSNSACCCVSLPTVVAVPNLSDVGITQPIALTTLEPHVYDEKPRANDEKAVIEETELQVIKEDKQNAASASEKKGTASRSLLVVLDKSSSSLYVFS